MIHLINGYANYQTAIIHENDKGMSDPDLTKDGILRCKRTYDNVIYRNKRNIRNLYDKY